MSMSWGNCVHSLVPAGLSRGEALVDQRPLRTMLARLLDAHDLRELAGPADLHPTCLDWGTAVHHREARWSTC